MDYMIIRVKEKESGEEKKEQRGRTSEKRENEEDSKGIEEVACLITILRWS